MFFNKWLLPNREELTMDKNTMLGRIASMIVMVPSEWDGALYDLLEKLNSNSGADWFHNLKLFLRKQQLDWPTIESPEKTGARCPEIIRQVVQPPVLRLVSGGEALFIPAGRGGRNIKDAKDVFTGGVIVSPFSENLNRSVPQQKSRPGTYVQIFEFLGKDISPRVGFGSFGKYLDRVCLTEEQIVLFVKLHGKWFCYGSFLLFLFKGENGDLEVANVSSVFEEESDVTIFPFAGDNCSDLIKEQLNQSNSLSKVRLIVPLFAF